MSDDLVDEEAVDKALVKLSAGDWEKMTPHEAWQLLLKYRELEAAAARLEEIEDYVDGDLMP